MRILYTVAKHKSNQIRICINSDDSRCPSISVNRSVYMRLLLINILFIGSLIDWIYYEEIGISNTHFEVSFYLDVNFVYLDDSFNRNLDIKKGERERKRENVCICIYIISVI